MNTEILTRLEADIAQLSLPDQVLLMEWLAQRIQERTLQQQRLVEHQLAAMASDPEIQRELQQLEADFAKTERDGLGAA